MYKSYEASVEITDADMTELRPILTADFASISLKAEDGVEIWVNEQKKGVGVWTGELASGAYIVECRKENHRKVSQTITVTPDMEVTEFILKSPEPICGGLSIVSSPGEADIYLDGAKVGSSPLYLPKTIIGNHILKISKSGCADWTGNVNISEGQIAEVNIELQSGIPVTFIADMSGAELYLDGFHVGSADGTYKVSYGDHVAVCRQAGKEDITKDITVSQTDKEMTVDFLADVEMEPIPFQLVEERPTFNGGDANKFSKWVNSRLVYPEVAKGNGVQGRVMLQFTIQRNGSIADVSVLRSVDPELDMEAVRVVSMSPKWKPGKQRGRAVPVRYTFPVIFQLR